MNRQRTTKPGSGTNKVGMLLFFSLLIVYLATASGRIDSGDGLAIFAVSQSLLEHQDVTIAPPDPDLITFDAQGRPLGQATDLGIEDGYSIRGRDGNYYSSYGIGQSLLILPFLVLGQFLAPATLPNSSQWMMQFVAAMLLNPLVSAAGGVLVYLTGRRLSFSSTKSIALAVIYAFGTMTWVYAKSFFSDPLIALLLLSAFYSLLSYRCAPRRQAWLWIGGASLGFAVLTKPASVVNVPVLLAYLIFIIKDEPKRLFFGHFLAFVMPIMIGVGGVMVYNWWRFESLIDTGYRNIGWTFPFVKGLYGLVASPGKGYLLYNPVIIGAIIGAFIFWHRRRVEFWVIVGIVVTNLLFLAKYDHWHGGGSWGPRLLLPLTPFVILPLGSLLENMPQKRLLNLLLAVLIAFSVVIQISGISVNYVRFLQKIYSLSVDQYYQRVTFEVTYSPLLGQWFEMREVVGNFRDPARRSAISQLAFQGDTGMSREQAMEILSVNLPDFWFIYLGLAHGNF